MKWQGVGSLSLLLSGFNLLAPLLPLPAALQNFKIPDETTRRLLTICQFLKRQNQFLKFALRS